MTRAVRPILMLAPLIGLLIAGAARAVPGGDIDVLTQGRYVCELPGDAGDLAISAGRRVPAADFSVINDSSYRIDGVTGVYLLTGDHVAMTNGPGRGRAFHLISESTLLAIDARGRESGMRCVRSVQRSDGRKPENSRCAKPARREDAPSLQVSLRADRRAAC